MQQTTVVSIYQNSSMNFVTIRRSLTHVLSDKSERAKGATTHGEEVGSLVSVISIRQKPHLISGKSSLDDSISAHDRIEFNGKPILFVGDLGQLVPQFPFSQCLPSISSSQASIIPIPFFYFGLPPFAPLCLDCQWIYASKKLVNRVTTTGQSSKIKRLISWGLCMHVLNLSSHGQILWAVQIPANRLHREN
jgi:hypothetical protein